MSLRSVLLAVSFLLVCTVPQYDRSRVSYPTVGGTWLMLLWGYLERSCCKHPYMSFGALVSADCIPTSGTAGSLESCVFKLSAYGKVSKVSELTDTPATLHPLLGAGGRNEPSRSHRLSRVLPSPHPPYSPAHTHQVALSQVLMVFWDISRAALGGARSWR